MIVPNLATSGSGSAGHPGDIPCRDGGAAPRACQRSARVHVPPTSNKQQSCKIKVIVKCAAGSPGSYASCSVDLWFRL